MAKEKIIEIKTGDAIKNINDLKNNISSLKANLGTLTIGTDEYKRTLRDLEDNQAALRNAMHGTAASMTEVMNAATAANVAFDDQGKLVKADTLSYNELVRELAVLKEQWRATTNAAERLSIGKQINSVNDKLKELDKSVGVFGRNVGNYLGAVDHLTAGLSSMGRGAAGLVAPLKGATAGFKALSATPAIAILGVLANVLQKVIDGLESSEENANEMSKALAPLQAIGDAVTNTLQALGAVVVKVAGWFGDLTRAILGNNDAANERLKIAEREADLAKSQRETLIANAEAERDIAELRAKSSDKEKYTATERLAMLEEAGRLEAQIAERAKEDAKAQYEIIKAKNALTESSKEELEAEAQAYANMVKAETAYYQQIRTINKGITTARNEERKAANEAAKAVENAARAKLEAEMDYYNQMLALVEDGSKARQDLQDKIAEAEYNKAVAEAKAKIENAQDLQRTLILLEEAFDRKRERNAQEYAEKQRDAELLEIRNIMDGYEKGSAEYLDLQVQLKQREYDTLSRLQGESDQAFLARRIAAFKELQKAREEQSDQEIDATRKALENEMEALASGSIERFKKAVEIAEYDLETMHQKIGESEEDFRARQLAAEKEYREAVQALTDEENERAALEIEQRMALLETNSEEYLALAVELKQHELDTLHQLEGESNEAFRLRELQAEKAYSDALKAQWKARVSIMTQVAGNMSDILSGIADALEQNTKNSKREAQRVKGLRIAAATIDTISGAVRAFTNAQGVTGNPIIDAVIGAASAAAVTLAGVTNIAKIKATDVEGGSGSSSSAPAPVIPASVEAPVAEPSVTRVSNVTSASEEERLNENTAAQRVYILDSDLEAADTRRKVAVAETTF